MLRVLDSFSDIAALTLEIRKLDQKVEKMGKTLQLVIDEKETNTPRSSKVINRDLHHAPDTTQSKKSASVNSNQTCPVDKDWMVIGSGCYKIVFKE